MRTTNFGPVQIGIILLTAATAIIHLGLGLQAGLIMFILNGIGYIVLATALYMPQFKDFHNPIRWVLIGFTAITVIAWVIVGERSMIAYIDKAIEILLMILLFIEQRRAK